MAENNFAEIKRKYQSFRKKVWNEIDNKNFNEAVNTSIAMEEFLGDSSNDSPESEKGAIKSFLVFVVKLKESCTYKNQRDAYNKLELLDSYYFNAILDN